jgi:hypothetical protein
VESEVRQETQFGHNLSFSERANLPLERLHYSVT